jgi:DNA-binding NtrC family response regulator
MSSGVLDLLLEYPWPGNVRELENCIERAVVMCPGEVLSADLLPEEIVSHKEKDASRKHRHPSYDEDEIRRATERFCVSTNNLAEAKQKLPRIVEETIIRTALSQKISQRELSEKLGMSRMTLRKKIREYGIKF